jgi:hypothetical protein
MSDTSKLIDFMASPDLTQIQLSIIERDPYQKIFLEGRAGTGKTTCGVERMLFLMSSGVPGSSILVLVPQRSLGQPYREALQIPGVAAGGRVTLLTLGGLARRMVELFWPHIAEKAGFAHPDDPPVFLTLETAQYFMAKVVRPLLQKGYFDTVTISRNRIYSQILDNLNKSAVVGFPYTRIGQRLENAWNGEPGQARIYKDAQDCASQFRSHCLENNLLDYSLQIEIFTQHLCNDDLFKSYLKNRYSHIIADNIEEDVPVTHDLLHDWLPNIQSCLLIYDQDAGYRRFLGADPISAYKLKGSCDEAIELMDSFIVPSSLVALRPFLEKQLINDKKVAETVDKEQCFDYIHERFFPELLDQVSGEIAKLVHSHGIPPGEIAVLAPFLSDALRFSLTSRLQEFDIHVRTHRPSRALREEPATQCLLTLAAIAHPSWNINPLPNDVTNSLLMAIEGLDPIRAFLLTQIVFQRKDSLVKLSSFDQINPEVKERITYLVGERFEKLRLWLLEYDKQDRGELDHFISRLFGELLSRPGYGFHLNYDAGETTANLVDSINNFRWAAEKYLQEEVISLGKEYFEMVQDGIIAAQYIEGWQLRPENAVLLAPAYTFLMSNQPVEIQFWLDIGSRGWAERLYQPLTHPYVLSRSWPESKKWTDNHEVETSSLVLYRLISGLINRCRGKIYLGLSEFNEQGYEQRGLLLRTLHHVLLKTSAFS